MAKISIVISIVLLAFLASLCFVSSNVIKKRDRNNQKYRVVCYIGTWAHYRKKLPVKIEDLNTEYCTHLMYEFAALSDVDYTIKMFDQWLDEHLKGYQRFNKLRERNPNLTTMISLGGWNEGSSKYSHMAKSPENRARFIKSVVAFLDKHEFDGIDMVWEYPGARDGDKINDKIHFIELLTEMKAALDPHGYVLSAVVPYRKDLIDNGYDVKAMDKVLDFYSVMTYAYHGGSFEKHIGHNAPLYAKPGDDKFNFTENFNVNFTINYLLSQGASKEKMVMGLPLHGTTYTFKGDLKKLPEFRSEAEYVDEKRMWGGKEGTIVPESGFLPYVEICQHLKDEKWRHYFDRDIQAPIGWTDSMFVGYDNKISLALKVSYLKRLGISGGMVWSLESDDIRGRCNEGKWPLLTRIHEMLNGKDKDNYETPPTPDPNWDSTTTTTTTIKEEATTKNPSTPKVPTTKV